MAEGAGVGRGAMGLQTLDASRGMSSPWRGFVSLESGSTYLPGKECRRVTRGYWVVKGSMSLPHIVLNLPALYPAASITTAPCHFRMDPVLRV